MNEFTKEVLTISDDLYNLPDKPMQKYKAIELAIQIQRNRIFSNAFMLGLDVPSALEAIAMELGAARSGTTIKDSLTAIADAIETRR